MLKVGLLLLALVGSWQLGSGSWIWAKAQLAQWLLEKSWHEMRAQVRIQDQVQELQQQQVSALKPWPWADTYATARLQVPALDVNMIVLQGDSGRTLAFGPGHSSDSAAPGTRGTTVISGHRDTHFTFLQHLKPGMPLQLQTLHAEWRYRVTQTKVIDSRLGGISLPDEQQGLLLVTCYPFEALEAGGPLRYLVWAEPEPEQKPEPVTEPISAKPLQAKTHRKTII